MMWTELVLICFLRTDGADIKEQSNIRHESEFPGGESALREEAATHDRGGVQLKKRRRSDQKFLQRREHQRGITSIGGN